MKAFILRVAFLLCALLWVTRADAAARFAVCTTTCTWDGSSTAMWSATTGGATGASVPGAGDSVILDGATCVGGTTCTITVNTNFSVLSFTMDSCTASTTGCILDLSINNNSPTIGGNGFSNSGTGVRTLKMGSGTWTVNSTNANAWVMSTVTNLTFQAGTSTLIINDTGVTANRTFNGGGQTYNNVTFNMTSGAGLFLVTGANILATLTLQGVAQQIEFQSGLTQTIATFAGGGASTSAPILITSNSSGGTATLAVTNNATLSFFGVRDITFTTGAIVLNSSANYGHNSGVTINPPASGGSGSAPCTGC